MVFFTCNACGESLKKAQVDKHVYMCRGCQVLSCIDCGRDFWGDEYKGHTQCISEDQKYGGKGYEAKSKKGDVKQQQWIQKVHEAMNKPGISSKLKDVLNQVSSFENVPRKKAKFQNWMKNSLKIYNAALQDQVWEIFSAADSVQQESASQQSAQAEVPKDGDETVRRNGGESLAPSEKKSKRERKEERWKRPGGGDGQVVEVEEGEDPTERRKKKRKRGVEGSGEDRTENGHDFGEEASTKKWKKRKQDSAEDSLPEDEEKAEEDDNQSRSKGKFNWKGTIKAVLRQSPEEGVSMKKLRKKVLAEYYSFTGEGNYKSEEEVLSLFNRKVKTNPKFQVLKDKVRLVK